MKVHQWYCPPLPSYDWSYNIGILTDIRYDLFFMLACVESFQHLDSAIETIPMLPNCVIYA